MSIATTRDQLIEHCLRELGKPVIEINVAIEQVQDCVDDALSLYHEFHYDAVERVYLKHQMSPTDCANGYVDIPDPVRGVVKIFQVGGIDSGVLSAANPFSLAYQLRINDLYTFFSTSLIDYYLYKRHMALMDQLLAGETPIRFNKHMNRVYIDADYTNQMLAGTWIIIDCYRILDPDDYPNIWADEWLRRYITALIKQRWGNNMKKFEGMRLPGGVFMNGQQIYNEATEEIKELRQELRDTWEEPPEMLVG